MSRTVRSFLRPRSTPFTSQHDINSAGARVPEAAHDLRNHSHTHVAEAVRLETASPANSSSLSKSSLNLVSPMLQILSVTLALIALLILASIDAQGEFSWKLALWWGLQTATLISGAYWIRRFAASRSHTVVVSPLLILLALSSLLWEPVSRTLFQTGRPLEILIMHSLGSVVWGLALFSVWPKLQGISVLMSLILATYSFSAANEVAIQGLAALFALVAVFWLTVRYWDQLNGRLRGQSTRRGDRLLVPGLIVLIVLLTFAGGKRRELMAKLNGFLPSSGGTGDSSPYARDGIGNGEMLVAGCENIQSFGPIDEAPFMTDDKPSLYDVFDDTYDEPVTPLNTDRSIALMPDENTIKNEHLHTESQRASREFSTSRKSPTAKRTDVTNLTSDALFFVSGRTPCHFRLQLYDIFDGVSWHAEQEPSSAEISAMSMVKEGDQDWLKLTDRKDVWEFLGPAETHAIKIVQLDTNVIPAPLHLHGVHIANVDRIDMYHPGQQGLIRMDREKLAELVPIHLASRTINRELLMQHPWPGHQTRHLDVPEPLREELTQLAQHWGADSPRGWPQIEAIVSQLRNNYQHDHSYREPVESSSPVLTFLKDSKRGPDYQFATAAAMLLRTLNYPTRVVSGFYAAPEEYDVKSGHTPVKKKDVHFWTEVRLGNGAWITLEPTPGYEVLQPSMGFWKSVQNNITASLAFIQKHFALFLTTALGISLLIWNRHGIHDSISVINWKLRPRQQTAIAAWKILNRRFRTNGWDVKSGTTPRQLLKRVSADHPHFNETFSKFLSELDEEVFSQRPINTSRQQAKQDSEQLLQLLTRSACRQLAVQHHGTTKRHRTRLSHRMFH